MDQRGVTAAAWAGCLLMLSCGSAPVTTPPRPCEGAQPGSEAELAAEYATAVHPLLLREPQAGGCASCHGPQAQRRFTVFSEAPRSFAHLVRNGLLAPGGPHTLVDRLGRSDGLRMPLGGPAWTADERAAVERLACRVEVSGLALTCEAVDPGTVVLRRLANEEYDRSVHAALGAPGHPSEKLAADQPAFGFDNVSRDQTFDVGRLERYRDVGERLAEETLLAPRAVEVTREAEDLPCFTYDGARTGPGQGSATDAGWRFQRIRSRLSVGLVQAPYPGEYTVEVWARGVSADHFTCQDPGSPTYTQCLAAMRWNQPPSTWGPPWVQQGAKPLPPKLEVIVDGRSTTVDVDGPTDQAALGPFQKFSVGPVPLEAGTHSLSVGLQNVIYWQGEVLDVSLEVDRVTWKGPATLPPADPARLKRLLRNCEAYSCGDVAVRDVLTALWRRPPEPQEVERYAALLSDAAAAGEPFPEGLVGVVSAAALSPHFLFRPEVDPQPDAPQSRPLTGLELATRLSYFLWGAPPDAELLAHAVSGELVKDEVLRPQVDRLLGDPRASALVDRFAWQWLELDKLSHVQPLNADFTEALRAAFVGELRALLQDGFTQDRPVTELIDSPRLFANATLARFYGLDAGGLSDDAFVAVSPGATGRGGLIASGGVLTMTSHPARTSPTIRGAWLLDRVLCRPPGAPPAVVPALGSTMAADGGMRSPRELLELHAQNPQCAGCHANMDPLGLALEAHDELGRARGAYPNGTAIDTRATLSSGETLTGLRDVIALIKADEGYSACLTRKMLVYALGSDPSRFDGCAFDDVRARFAEGGGTFKALVRAVATSAMFRSRRPAKPGEFGEESP